MKNLFEEMKPIGAVVREADRVFSNLTRKTKANGTFNRLEWHFFSLLKERKQLSEAEAKDYLGFFASGPHIQKIINRFIHENLLSYGDHGMYLSQTGERVFEEVAQKQAQIKEKAIEGVSSEAYNITVDTLQQIVYNLQEFLPAGSESQHIESKDTSPDPEPLKKRNEHKIRELVAEMEKAHNTKDPELLASLFTDDAVFVNAVGIRLRGKEAIYQSAMKVMTTVLAKSYARYEVSHINFIKEDIAIAEIYQRPVTLDGEVIEDDKAGVPTYILVQEPESGKWYIRAAQNTLEMRTLEYK